MGFKSIVASLVVAVPALIFSAQTRAADIVDTAVQAQDFTSLVKALRAAGLVDTLRGNGPFTVFAPTDRAFAGIDAETMDALMQSENREKLAAILGYHVVPGNVTANDALGNQTFLKTVEGANLFVQGVAGTVLVANGVYDDRTRYAEVVQADIIADNGIIHVIDKVIIPPVR